MVDALKLSKKVKNWTMTVCIADFRYNRSCQLPINLLILGFRNHLFFVSTARGFVFGHWITIGCCCLDSGFLHSLWFNPLVNSGAGFVHGIIIARGI